MLGINATADTTNRLSVSSPVTLLNHDGSDYQLKMNKASETDTVSLLYQTGFSGCAELGLAGSDDLSIKVSADGSTWTEAMRTDLDTGLVSMPKGLDSEQFVILTGQVAQVTPPSSGGFAMLSSVSENFPQTQASAILCYDVEASPTLKLVWGGTAIESLENTLPKGTSGTVNKVSIAVQNNGDYTSKAVIRQICNTASLG
jgi:hypothetical protein